MVANIYPLSYSIAVYEAVGRCTMQCNSTNDLMDRINQAKVLNFTLIYKDNRSLAFINHMTQLMDNPLHPAYKVILVESLKYMPKHHWIEDKDDGS